MEKERSRDSPGSRTSGQTYELRALAQGKERGTNSNARQNLTSESTGALLTSKLGWSLPWTPADPGHRCHLLSGFTPPVQLLVILCGPEQNHEDKESSQKQRRQEAEESLKPAGRVGHSSWKLANVHRREKKNRGKCPLSYDVEGPELKSREPVPREPRVCLAQTEQRLSCPTGPQWASGL